MGVPFCSLQYGVVLTFLTLSLIQCQAAAVHLPVQTQPLYPLKHWLFQGASQNEKWVSCKNEMYLYLQPKYKGLHNQVNVFIMGLQLADMYNLTLVLPDWHSHYEPAVNGQGVYAPICESGTADDLAHTQPAKCSMVLEFRQLWDEDYFYTQMRPHHCIMKGSTARQLGIIPNITQNRMNVGYNIGPLALLNSDVYYNYSAAVPGIQKLKQAIEGKKVPTVFMKTRVGPGQGVLEAVQFKRYMQLRMRAAAFSEPSALVKRYSDKVLQGLLAKAPAFNAIHLRIEKDMQDWLAKTGRPFMDAAAVVKWLSQHEMIRKDLPMFIAIDNVQEARDVKQAFVAAGFPMVHTKADFVPELAEIKSHREFRGAVERAVLEKALVFIGNHHSSLSFYIYEKRRAMGLYNLDYHDVNPNVDLFRAVGGHNSGSVKIQRYNICLWAKLLPEPFQGSVYFFLALAEAIRRMGHSINLVYEDAPQNPHMAINADIHIVAQSQINITTLDKYLPKATDRTGGVVVFQIDNLYRTHGGLREQDDSMFSTISRYKTAATVFKTNHAYKEALALGYDPLSAVMAGQAVEPLHFFPALGKGYDLTGAKVQIIASICHMDMTRNFEFIQYLNDKLDHDKYAVYVVGLKAGVAAAKKVKYLPSLGQKELGTVMRSAEMFLLASSGDCSTSNDVLHALSCGLPVVAPRVPSYAELVGKGGLLYTGTADIIQQIEKIAGNYQEYVEGIAVPHIDELAIRYLQASGKF